MRLFREETKNIQYESEITPDPPDTIFGTSVPLVYDNKIFDSIDNHLDLTDHQRFF